MGLIFIFFGIIIVAAVIVTISNKRNKTYVMPKNNKTDLTLSADDIIRLRETVGKFTKGEKHYCNVCDSVSIHLEEDLSGEIFGTFSIFSFLLPWKWAIVASLFFLKDEKIHTVCINCNPSFYEDWLTYRKRKSKIFFRNILITLSILFLLYLFLS